MPSGPLKIAAPVLPPVVCTKNVLVDGSTSAARVIMSAPPLGGVSSATGNSGLPFGALNTPALASHFGCAAGGIGARRTRMSRSRIAGFSFWAVAVSCTVRPFAAEVLAEETWGAAAWRMVGMGGRPSPGEAGPRKASATFLRSR